MGDVKGIAKNLLGGGAPVASVRHVRSLTGRPCDEISNNHGWRGLACPLAFRRGETPCFEPKVQKDLANAMTSQNYPTVLPHLGTRIRRRARGTSK